ncbi:MAG: hypothetical protein WCP21_11730 [Armatimonadota bacterium]
MRIAPIVLLSVTLATAALAGGGPENVALVVNADNADSVTLAMEYSRLRQIPARNLIRLSGLPITPSITVAQFRDQIMGPVLQTVARRGLQRQIDYVIYSCGFPYAVDVSADMAGRKFPRIITQPASLTGLTYLYEAVMAGDTSHLTMDSNWNYRSVKRQGPPLTLSESEQQLQTRLEGLLSQFQKAKRDAAEAKTAPSVNAVQALNEAVTILQALTANHKSAELLYDLACVLALSGKDDEAMATLQAAFDAGWWNAGLTEKDSDLTSLRGREDFKALLEKMSAAIVETEPPLPFHSEVLWSRTGQPGHFSEGRRYLLSAMLGYVGPAANTLDEALQCLRTSAAADGTCPKGTIYYMASTDWARTGPRQWAFKSAVEALGKLGVKAEALDGVLPPKKADVAGAMVGIATFKWPESGSSILPGAFCDHLTSCAGIMTGGGQTVLSEWLRYGAAGSAGTVTEPYNTPVKFPTPFVHVYYASGCSLAEAFYQSVRAPYQQLLVGDPLCQPWAKAPSVSVVGLAQGEAATESRWLRPSASGPLAATEFALYVDGVRRHTCKAGGRLRLDLEGLKAGEHDARIVCLAGPLDTQGRLIVPFRTP